MKISRDETNMSHLVQSSSSKVGFGHLQGTYRPISAMVSRKKSNGVKHLPSLYKTSVTDSTPMLTSSNFSKTSHPSTTLEKERLYEETLQLKNQINTLKRDLAAAKSENHKKGLEINRKDKVIEDIASESGAFGSMMPVSNDKAKDASLIIKMRKQYKNLQKEFKSKCEEFEELKKLSKLTKLNELNVEIKTLTEELNKVKTLYSHSLQQNELNENNFQEIQTLQENFNKQHFIITSLQETLAKAEEENKLKDSEVNKLKSELGEKSEKIKKMKKDLQLSNQMNEKLSKEKGEPNGKIKEIKARYEEKLSDMTKELSRYKGMVDQKDRQVRQLESQIKSLSSIGGNSKASNFNYNEIKSFQANPEENLDNMTLLLKSKLHEQIAEKKNVKKNCKILKKKVKFYEAQLGYAVNEDQLEDISTSEDEEDRKNLEKGEKENNKNNKNNKHNISNAHPKSMVVPNSNSNRSENDSNQCQSHSDSFTEEQLTEFTYILIKNFEAKKITYEEASKKLINEVFKNKNSEESEAMRESAITVLCENIYTQLNVQNEDDKQKIKMFLNTILSLANKDVVVFIDKLMSLFHNVKIYTPEEEGVLKKKLKKHLKGNLDYLKNILISNDTEQSGNVTFLALRKMLESINLRLKDKYIEYLIYAMKSLADEKSTIYDLKYQALFSIIEEAEEDSNEYSSEEEIGNEEDDSEIVITTDQFNEKVTTFLRSLSVYLKMNKSNLRELFKFKIYKPSEIELDPAFKDIPDEAVELKIFLQEMKRVSIELSNLDVYCIYTKFKIMDGYEAISISTLETELYKYGVEPYSSAEIGFRSKSKF